MLKRHLLATALLIGLTGPALADYAAGYNAYVAGNYATARSEFEAAARTGDTRSQYMLGRIYAEGRGVTQDYVQAHAWYNIAAAGGYSAAVSARDSLAGRMTASQISLAQTRAATLQSGIAVPVQVSTGYSVRDIQQLLNQRGYDAGPADGVMGLRTRTAIQAYQRTAGLPVTGQPSLALYNHLLGGAPAPAQPQTPPPVQQASGYSLHNLQAALNQRGYNAGVADGVIGARTRTAISAYQADNGLVITGQPSASLYQHILANTGNAPATQPVAQADAQFVTAIQTELRRRGYSVPTVNGRLDSATVAAIRTYQADAGLSVNGLATQSLLTSLQSDSATAATGSTDLVTQIQVELRRRGYDLPSVTGRLDSATIAAIRAYQADSGLTVTGQASDTLLANLRVGQGGSQVVADQSLVRQIQQALNTRGYGVGTPDGVLGPRTRDAIRTYQADSGLPVTGQPSQTLLASLQSSGGAVVQQPLPVPAVDANLIVQLEQALSRKGYRVGPIDGIFDVQTQAAVRQYQTDARLPITGEVSTALLNSVQTSGVYAAITPGGIVRDLTGEIFNQLQQQIGQ